MVDIYQLILDEFEERGCAHFTRFPPFFMASIGAHMFNLVNKKNHVYYEAGKIADARLHSLFVAPPGFSKTFWLEQFLRGDHAIMKNSGIDIGFEAAMTEAGFVGTIRFVDGDIVPTPGAAQIYAKAIVGVEEFSALTEMMKQQYARQLDTALLGALDSGWVYKRLAAGNLSYQTDITLQTGVQPARFDLSSGLGRRFLFIQFIPEKIDFETLKIARRQAKGRRYNPVRTERIRQELRNVQIQLNSVKEVTFTEKVYKLFDELEFVHFEEPLFEKLLIGYTVMRGNMTESTKIDLDRESERIIRDGVNFRKQIRRGAEFSEVLVILKERGGKMKLFELKEHLLIYGLDWEQSSLLIFELQRLRAIDIRGDEVILSPTLLSPTEGKKPVVKL